MADYTVTRPGAQNAPSTTSETTARENMLRVWGGEIYTVFNRNLVMQGLMQVKECRGSRTVTFPNIGNIGSAYHTIGAELTGSQQPTAAERSISVDSLVVANVTLAKIDEALMHYDVRAPYTEGLAVALRNRHEQTAMQVAIRAARSSSILSGTDPLTGAAYPGGDQLRSTTMATDFDVLRAKMLLAAQKFDEKNVQDDVKVAILRPAQYWGLIGDTDAININWGGKGSLSSGELGPIGNLRIVKSNSIPSTNVSTNPTGVDPNNDYRGDFTNTVGIVITPRAVGCAKVADITLEHEYSVARKGTLLTADYAMGYGVLRPECAIELSSAAAAVANP